MGLAGCASIRRPTARIDNNLMVAPLAPYSGPKAGLAISDFEVKTAKATGEIGSGLRDMLITALINSNRFSVVERKVLGAVENGSPRKEKIKTADLIITAAITEFQPQASGGRAGVGGGGGVGSGILGGLLGAALNKAHMALDIRIVDTSTSEILASTHLEAQASDIGGEILTGLFGKKGLGDELSVYTNTPMEKAIRICIIEAVRYISQVIPTKYYKY